MKLEFCSSSQRNLARLFVAATEYVAPAWQDVWQQEFASVLPFQLIEEL
jgi:hypothetical protein